MSMEDLIEDIDNETLREALKDMENKSDLSQLKIAFPDYENHLTAIESFAHKPEQVDKERLLDDNGRPEHGAVFRHFDKQHHFIHYLSRHGEPTRRILAYKDGYYRFGGGLILKNKFQRLLPASVSKHHKKEVVDRAYNHRMGKKGSTENSLTENIVNLNSPEWKLNFTNGVLDIEEMELLNHSPEFHFTSQIPYDYNPEAEEPEKWFDFLEEVLPNTEIQMKKLQEWFGYLLKHWDADFEKAALLLGPTNSGKGVIISTAKAVLGEDNVSQMALKSIVDSPFGNQQLLGKIANLNNDLNHHSITNTGEAKRVISGEDVAINQKNKPRFVAEPNTKHFYSANYPPRDTISDDAYYERWLTFRVPETIPTEDQDRDLREKLADERQGIMNWAIEGLQRLEEQGQFTGQRTHEETKSIWRRYGDPIARFYHHALEYNQGSRVKKETCFKLIEEYCDALNEEVPSKKRITQYITNQKRGIEDGMRHIDGRSQRVFLNAKLSDNARQILLSEAE